MLAAILVAIAMLLVQCSMGSVIAVSGLVGEWTTLAGIAYQAAKPKQ